MNTGDGRVKTPRLTLGDIEASKPETGRGDQQRPGTGSGAPPGGDTDAGTDAINARLAYVFRFNVLTTGTEKVFCLGWACQVRTYYDIWGAGDNGTTFSIYQAMGGSAGYEPSDWDDNSGGATYQK